MTRVAVLLAVSAFVLGAPCPGSVECESNSDCDGDEGVCADGECVECEDDGDCEGNETCEDNECEPGAGGEGEGEGEGEVPVDLIARICVRLVGCGLEEDPDRCNAEGQAFFEQIPDDPVCDELRVALIAFYSCAAGQDCAFFQNGPQEGGPCFAELTDVNNLSVDLGSQCSSGGEGEGEPEPAPSCREFIAVGDGCDCGCFESDPDCTRGPGCTEPGCFVEACDVCWVDEFTPERCGP